MSLIAYYILGVVDVVVVAGTRCSVQGNASHVTSEPSSLVIDDATRVSLTVRLIVFLLWGRHETKMTDTPLWLC